MATGVAFLSKLGSDPLNISGWKIKWPYYVIEIKCLYERTCSGFFNCNENI